MKQRNGSETLMCAGRLQVRIRRRRLTRVYWIAKAILFLLLSRTPGALAQVDTTHTFYPMGKGNVWVYRDFSYFASEATDTISAIILGDTTMQGRSYTATRWLSYRYQNSSVNYERFDSTGDVYRFDTYYGAPQLLYRLSDTSRTVWHRGNWNVRFDSSTYRVVFGRRVRVLFVNFYSSLDSAFAHSPTQEQLAEGLGLIGVGWPEGSSRILIGARINGATYGIIDDVDAQSTEVPGSFELLPNFPNPFNPSTTIKYRLPVRSLVDLKIFDLLGRETAALAHGWKDAGYHQSTWNAYVPSGIYFYRLQAGEFVETKKMVLIK
jgi:hypothetical protein